MSRKHSAVVLALLFNAASARAQCVMVSSKEADWHEAILKAKRNKEGKPMEERGQAFAGTKYQCGPVLLFESQDAGYGVPPQPAPGTRIFVRSREDKARVAGLLGAVFHGSKKNDLEISIDTIGEYREWLAQTTRESLKYRNGNPVARTAAELEASNKKSIELISADLGRNLAVIYRHTLADAAEGDAGPAPALAPK